jgi:hypothetical protein
MLRFDNALVKEHELKCRAEYYDAIASGAKPFELRLDDRHYAVGDILHLRRTDDSGYTGQSMRRTVTYLLRGEPWLVPGYVALGLGDATLLVDLHAAEQARNAALAEAETRRKELDGAVALMKALKAEVAELRRARQWAKAWKRAAKSKKKTAAFYIQWGNAVRYAHERYYPLLPQLRAVARECGYALGLHGSVSRDLDLIAVPWTDTAFEGVVLAEALRAAVDGVFRANDENPTAKPHGRQAWRIFIGGKLYIDLSVMPL